jgi:hypothetical protein
MFRGYVVLTLQALGTNESKNTSSEELSKTFRSAVAQARAAQTKQRRSA